MEPARWILEPSFALHMHPRRAQSLTQLKSRLATDQTPHPFVSIPTSPLDRHDVRVLRTAVQVLRGTVPCVRLVPRLPVHMDHDLPFPDLTSRTSAPSRLIPSVDFCAREHGQYLLPFVPVPTVPARPVAIVLTSSSSVPRRQQHAPRAVPSPAPSEGTFCLSTSFRAHPSVLQHHSIHMSSVLAYHCFPLFSDFRHHPPFPAINAPNPTSPDSAVPVELELGLVSAVSTYIRARPPRPTSVKISGRVYLTPVISVFVVLDVLALPLAFLRVSGHHRFGFLGAHGIHCILGVFSPFSSRLRPFQLTLAHCRSRNTRLIGIVVWGAHRGPTHAARRTRVAFSLFHRFVSVASLIYPSHRYPRTR
ncbi:hypothetical protein ONZ51_g10763 [Trametes cubensis]|uniref:Uncharacterized protein n=1 Tax=Trametes cubensis TaxID=1111947 RepID=A0AAD7X8I5_9APHY|nr:hypothetical protein ONZ51_g10763 [Trametes cubensis]